MRIALVLLLASAAHAVDRAKFRKCDDAGFCKRHRSKTAEPPMRLRADTLQLDAAAGLLTAAVDVTGAPHLDLYVHFYASGIARARLAESDGKPPRWEPSDVLLASGMTPAPSAALLSATDPLVTRLTAGTRRGQKTAYVRYTDGEGAVLLLALGHNPFQLLLFPDDGSPPGLPAVVVNERGLLHYEQRRAKPGSEAAALNASADGAAAASVDPHAAAPAAAAAAERVILDWGEDGKPIYADDEGGEAAAAAAAAADAAAAPGAAPGAADAADASLSLWEESFGTHRDSKPHGPMSVGMDVSFPSASHAYGIPEHASSHALHATDGSDASAEYAQPYRLYNLDVFEYELDNPMALYGSIPFMLAHGPGGRTAGVYWNNPTETYVDVAFPARGAAAPAGAPAAHVATRWVSESGVWDVSLIAGPAPKRVLARYTSLLGAQALPPLFALGYHQCRWNYKDEADVFAVDAKFEELAFPYDVLWLDIEHTDGKRYFTWDARLFPAPAAMQERLAARGHQMVTIVDPHIKKDAAYHVHAAAQARGLYVRAASGGEYDGWCWPGSSGYLDFTSPAVRDWWAEQFSLANYAGSTTSLFTWNDMNEPSVFNGPEVSMHKDALSLAGVEHREWHNLYGFYQQAASAEGQVRRSAGANARPFVLSRAFFAGSQRHGAIWTGDNAAKWEHLRAAAPMLLSIGAAGLAFAGADVGGFFGNPSTELMRRWYQAGAFTPFFRAHAHIDTARREPWLFGDDVTAALRAIVRTRYSYLPLWYTLFAEAAASGAPPMRPLWMEFPADAAAFGIDDAWLVGDALLVKPVTAEGAVTADVYFPGAAAGALWYDAATLAPRRAEAAPVTVPAPLDTLPLFQRGGAIVPRQMRPRRASAQMAADPYTLVVTLDAAAAAAGTLYLDDGATLDYARKGAFRLRNLTYAPEAAAGGGGGAAHVLRSSAAGGGKAWAPANVVERVIVAGAHALPLRVTATDAAPDAVARAVAFDYDAAADVITIRKPALKVAYDWTLRIEF